MKQSTLQRLRQKPGGSNVGKYSGQKTVGTSGGAPKGSYPVTKGGAANLGRMRAAVAYSRHAPNPKGIKKAVARFGISKGGKFAKFGKALLARMAK